MTIFKEYPAKMPWASGWKHTQSTQIDLAGEVLFAEDASEGSLRSGPAGEAVEFIGAIQRAANEGAPLTVEVRFSGYLATIITHWDEADELQMAYLDGMPKRVREYLRAAFS